MNGIGSWRPTGTPKNGSRTFKTIKIVSDTVSKEKRHQLGGIHGGNV